MPVKIASFIAFLIISSQTLAQQVSPLAEQCDGAKTVEQLPILIIRCDGNYVLTGGSIDSEIDVQVFASKSLSLQGIQISAKSLLLSAETIVIDSSTRLIVFESASISSNTPGVAPVSSIGAGATISVSGSVPERIDVSAGEISPIGHSVLTPITQENSPIALAPIAASAPVQPDQTSTTGGGAFDPKWLLLLGVATIFAARRHAA